MDAMHCNVCGLPARRFASLRCPSCGADAHAVGLSQRTGPLIGRAALAWTAIVGAAFLAAIIFLNTKRYTLSSAVFARYADRGPLQMFVATARGEGFTALPTPDRISLSLLTRTGVAVEAHAKLPDGRWTVRRAGNAATTILTAPHGRAAIDDLLRHAGIDPARPDAAAQADEAMMPIETALQPERSRDAYKRLEAFNASGGGRTTSGRRSAAPWQPC